MNTIERHVLELIGENPDAPDVFVDTTDGLEPIRDSINDAIEEISMLTGGYREKYYLSLRKNRNFYRFSSSQSTFAWATDVWLMTQGRRLEQTDLVRLNNYNPRWMLNTGTPQSYVQIGLENICIWPAPSSDSDIIEISAAMIPKRYETSDDRIKLRRDWEWAAAHFATGEYYASRGDAKTAIYHHNEYLKKLGMNTKYPYAKEYVPYLQTNKEYWPKSTG